MSQLFSQHDDLLIDIYYEGEYQAETSMVTQKEILKTAKRIKGDDDKVTFGPEHIPDDAVKKSQSGWTVF